MKTNCNTREFKPSTYCDNVSEPLLEHIKELENELIALKKQVQALQIDNTLKEQQLPHEALSLPRSKRGRTDLTY
jgi:hypothetical protein